MPALLVAAIAASGAVLAALGTYLIGRRQTSGTIKTSEASTLWTESQAMRKELRDEVERLRTDLVDRDKRCAEEVAQLRTSHEQQLADLRTSGERRENDLGELRKRLDDMQRTRGTRHD